MTFKPGFSMLPFIPEGEDVELRECLSMGRKKKKKKVQGGGG